MFVYRSVCLVNLGLYLMLISSFHGAFLAKSREAKGWTYDVQDVQKVTNCRKEKGSNIQTQILGHAR